MFNEKSTHIEAIKNWFGGLQVYADKLPARGTVAGALHLLERLKDNYLLDIDAHRAHGGAQIAGLTPSAIARILERFGETRPFLKEGGRTNRGGPGDLAALLATIKALRLDTKSESQRNNLLSEMQEFIATRLVREYFDRKRIEFAFDPAATTAMTIGAILAKAIQQKKGGPVAEHLVGAKLKLRFPNMEIRNKSTSTADDPTGAPGDFVLGETAFHVSVAPSLGHWIKCKKNLQDGLRVYMLVPDSKLVGARQIAEQEASGRIAVESIESFVATNLDEISVFSQPGLVSGLTQLLKLYNERVDAVESDKSLLIELPKNLK
jgi:hypothetical protein